MDGKTLRRLESLCATLCTLLKVTEGPKTKQNFAGQDSYQVPPELCGNQIRFCPVTSVLFYEGDAHSMSLRRKLHVDYPKHVILSKSSDSERRPLPCVVETVVTLCFL